MERSRRETGSPSDARAVPTLRLLPPRSRGFFRDAPPAARRVLRLSVTDRCNLRCRYCVPATGAVLAPRRALPSLERILLAVGWLVANLDVDRIKLTGGEPLVRRGVVSLIRQLAALGGVREVSMTTNGTRLPELAHELRRAGLVRVNVSLDTVDPERFRILTRGGDVRRVVAGIDAALDAGLRPLKLNAVLRSSSWREDVPDLLSFAAERGVEVRFIELMRTGTEAEWAAAEFVAASEVRRWLTERARCRPVPGSVSSPARRTSIRWQGREVIAGWITPVSHSFCSACNRLRLDARGRLRRCLMDPEPFPLLELLEKSPGEVENAVHGYLAGKRPPKVMDTGIAMQMIGG